MVFIDCRRTYCSWSIGDPMHASTPGLKPVLKKSARWLASQFGPHRFGGGDPRLWILMYHRILPLSDPRSAAEEPGMIVTPETFRQHLRELKQLFTLLPLSEWIGRKKQGKPLPRRACAITFDDGWLDNYEFALPILEQEQATATVFAVSHMIGTRREFWPNRLARILMCEPQQLHRPELRWLAELDSVIGAARPDRERIASIIDACKQLPDSELNARLDQAESLLTPGMSPTPSLVNWDQLRAMDKSGRFEIGSHTCNHYRLLGDVDAGIVSREILASKLLLQEQLGKPVTLFCYPNGDASPAAVDLVRQHYSAAVTTQRGINVHSVDDYSLRRIAVHEDISSSRTCFRSRLSGWF